MFGASLAPGKEIISARGPLGEAQETDEVYILCDDEINLKIRFDLLDVKKLVQVGEDGLELWAPVSKTQFPLSSEQIETGFRSMGIAPIDIPKETYDLNMFLTQLVDPHSDLEAVHVHKRRVRYTVNGCMAELTSLTANGVATNTIAVESEDREAVLGGVEQLGLSDHVNTSYSRGLRCLLGLAPVRYAVVDIGTNSVKFHIGQQHTDGTWTRIVDRAEVTRLGEGLDVTGEIQAEPLERTVRAVESMAEEARRHDALGTAVVGTAALRIADNSTLATDSIRDRVGPRVEVLSGEEESRLAYMAVVAELGWPDEAVVVFDTGGGSTQFTFGRGHRVDERYSVNVGAVSYTERFGLQGVVEPSVLEEARVAVGLDLASLDGRPIPAALVGMGGAVTNLVAVSLELQPYDPDVVQGASLRADQIERQIEMYRSTSEEKRRGIVGLQANRAPVILAGALIVRTVMEKLGKEAFGVSDRGLRHGLVRERFGLFAAC